MLGKTFWVGAMVASAGLVAACGSEIVPAGQDYSVDGQFTTGWACACPSGLAGCGLACPDGTSGSCRSGQPYCDVQVIDGGSLGCACPNGEASCSIMCPDGSSGQCTGSEPSCGGQADAGTGGPIDACPALGCFPSCPNGILKDSNGCDTCQCADAGAGGLQWYTTCGYPVCQAPTDAGAVDAGPACPAAGSPCSQAGDTCGTASAANCGVTLVCATQDPKGGVGGCPISSRKYKDGISYVDEGQLQTLHDEALGIRLATYTYKPQVDDPGPKHLGFIIEDNLSTPAVDSTHHRVDMYGYVSMVVAGMQVQEKEIASLRKELEAARRDIATCRATRQGR